MSLAPVVPALGEAAGVPDIAFAGDCIGDMAADAVAALGDGQVLVLENLRYHPGEEANDPGFAAELAALADLYVNDAFSCAHRAHASTEGITHHLPTFAGRAMQAELAALEGALGTPEKPVGAVVGGAKVSTKLDVLLNLVERVDHLLIGGAMANTFLFAAGHDVGRSLHEPDLAETARDVMAAAEDAACALHLPSDFVVAADLAAGVETQTVPADAIPADMMALDVGGRTVAAYSAAIEACRTLVWNGPLGAFEVEPFDAATNAVARVAAAQTQAGRLNSVAGGGDTVAALARAGAVEDFSYISTAGGAFLEWLEGRELPGVAALAQGG
jgi:phosphoglycerate kinase